MKKIIVMGLMLFLFLSLSGCMQFGTVVRVKPDGSGFIEETFLMRKDFLQQMQAMAENMAKEFGQAAQDEKKDAKANAQPPDFFSEAKLKERIKDMGEGVTYVSSSKITADDYEGVKAIYAFSDINKVRIKQDVKEKIPSAPAQDEAGSKKKPDNISFIFTRGNPAELIIKLPADKVPARTEAPGQEKTPAPVDQQPGEEEKAVLMNMFKGMKMSLYVDVDGTIVETNASYKNGARVTLLEIDFGRLMEKPEQLLKISQSRPATLEEMRRLMEGFPGIKAELNSEIKIKFR